jgi:hypothetical protein
VTLFVVVKEQKKPTYYLLTQTKEAMEDWLFYLKDQIKIATLIKSPTESEKLRSVLLSIITN